MSDETTKVCPGGHSTAHPAPGLRPDEYLCRGCVRHAERILGDLPSLTRDLETTVTRQDRAAKSGRGTKTERPLPANLIAADRGRTTLELLFEWADFVAQHYGVKGLPMFAAHRPLTELVPPAVAILLTHAEWMRTNEQGPGLAEAIRCVRRDLRAIVDRKPERLYAGPCLADLGYDPTLGYDCRLPVYRPWGTDDITCDGHTVNVTPGQWTASGCGRLHLAADRKEWLLAEVTSRLLPLRLVWESLYVLIPDCQVEWETAKQWTRERRQRVDDPARKRPRIIVSPPRLEPQSWAAETPLYRGADILRLAEDKQPRRGRRRVPRGEVA
jgi:hypothetical protein